MGYIARTKQLQALDMNCEESHVWPTCPIMVVWIIMLLFSKLTKAFTVLYKNKILLGTDIPSLQYLTIPTQLFIETWLSTAFTVQYILATVNMTCIIYHFSLHSFMFTAQSFFEKSYIMHIFTYKIYSYRDWQLNPLIFWWTRKGQTWGYQKREH